jgi:hemerythrin
MALIVWNEQLSVGVPQMDEQHQRLVQLVNQLHDAMGAGQGRDFLHKLLVQLEQYTITHFAAEDQLMQQAGYPDLAPHQAAHEELKRQVAELRQRHAGGESRLTIGVMSFLEKWLTTHIKGTDRKYASLLATAAKV